MLSHRSQEKLFFFLFSLSVLSWFCLSCEWTPAFVSDQTVSIHLHRATEVDRFQVIFSILRSATICFSRRLRHQPKAVSPLTCFLRCELKRRRRPASCLHFSCDTSTEQTQTQQATSHQRSLCRRMITSECRSLLARPTPVSDDPAPSLQRAVWGFCKVHLTLAFLFIIICITVMAGITPGAFPSWRWHQCVAF